MIPYRIDYTAKACFDVGNDGRYLTAVAGKIVDTRKGAVAGSITAFKVNTCQMRSVGIDPVTALSLEESTENYEKTQQKAHAFQPWDECEVIQLTTA